MKHSVKRKLIQIAAFGYSNPFLQNFSEGKLYSGKWKNFCNPGLNCYSCPAASLACPIGALQTIGASADYSVSLYAIGILLAFGTVLGRAVCAFLCPFGLIQELLHKIPSPKFSLPKPLTCIKYAVLIIFVGIIPAAVKNYAGTGSPAFCKYICPAGTLEAGIPLLLAHPQLAQMLGWLFGLKGAILLCVILFCIFDYRFFCKLLCPLGAIYGLLNKVSLCRLRRDKTACDHCGACARACRMDVDPVKHPDSAECIRCGACVSACPKEALQITFRSGEGITGRGEKTGEDFRCQSFLNRKQRRINQ